MAEIDTVQYYFEYCSGGDLYQLCQQYNSHVAWLPEALIWKVYLQLCSALEYLHRGFEERRSDRPGIVHRDIKPENILLRRSLTKQDYPDVVLADFGCASFDFATYEPAGTPRWQGQELPRKSPRGDVWSLGAVIHDMIYMELPILPLPADIEPTRQNMDWWEQRPETRAPITEVPDYYSTTLVNMMLLALEMNHNKRATAGRLVAQLKEASMEIFVTDEGIERAARSEPLASWAFDHMILERVDGESTDIGHEDDKGRRQYLTMMIALASDEQIASFNESVQCRQTQWC